MPLLTPLGNRKIAKSEFDVEVYGGSSPTITVNNPLIAGKQVLAIHVDTDPSADIGAVRDIEFSDNQISFVVSNVGTDTRLTGEVIVTD